MNDLNYLIQENPKSSVEDLEDHRSYLSDEANENNYISSNINFYRVDGKSKLFSFLETVFRKKLVHLYGCQESALKKIKDSYDRICELMFIGKDLIGLIVYKNDLQEEFGLTEAFELKTLLLIDPERHSGKRYGSMLMERVEGAAKNMKAKVVYCTCAVNKNDSLAFHQKKGFKITDTISKVANPEGKELLLVKALKKD